YRTVTDHLGDWYVVAQVDVDERRRFRNSKHLVLRVCRCICNDVPD
ncbi:unnamed protein product, partial [Ectocarpus sp. 12 AP-2014]